MTDRRTALLDAALDVVGERGLRALTHRAVDAAADVPAGSASNVFRTRADLVAALLDRLLERELDAWESLAATVPEVPASRAEAVTTTAHLLGETVRALSGPARGLTLARQALFHEAAFDPELQRRVAAARARLARRGLAWFAALGLDVDDAGLALVLDVVNGMLANRMAVPGPGADPDAALRIVLDAVAARV